MYMEVNNEKLVFVKLGLFTLLYFKTHEICVYPYNNWKTVQGSMTHNTFI